MKLISQVLAVAAVATLVVPALAQTSTMSHPMMKKPMTAKKMAMKNHKMIMNNRMMIKKHTKMMKGMSAKPMMHSGSMMHSTMKPMTTTPMTH